MNADLFSQIPQSKSTRPLAWRLRPQDLDEFVGLKELWQKYPFLTHPDHPALILYGPCGSGKTTLAHLLAKKEGREIFSFNAVMSGVGELRKLIDRAQEMQRFHQKRPILFIDEIHRFNKAQQDALLPSVESGDILLIGATTENPRVSINRALLSRVQIIELSKLSRSSMQSILERAMESEQFYPPNKIIDLLVSAASGDARRAISSLESIQLYCQQNKLDPQKLSLDDIQEFVLTNAREFDPGQDRHYDVISAFIKSMRATDPDGALLWLAVMLDGGEDPIFIARRMVIFASEDIGNADPRALSLAINCLEAVEKIGLPEARINLAQGVCYLASTVKSRASYEGIGKALEYVKNQGTIEVPAHLRNHKALIQKDYLPPKLPAFYCPTDQGQEKFLKERLEKNQLR